MGSMGWSVQQTVTVGGTSAQVVVRREAAEAAYDVSAAWAIPLGDRVAVDTRAEMDPASDPIVAECQWSSDSGPAPFLEITWSDEPGGPRQVKRVVLGK